MFTQCLGEALPPALQVRFSWIEPAAVETERLNAKVAVGMGFIVMDGEDIRVVGAELRFRECTDSVIDCASVGAGWHGQHDIERFAARAVIRQPVLAAFPFVANVLHCLTAKDDFTVFVLQRYQAVARYVVEVCFHLRDAFAAAGDLHHDFGRFASGEHQLVTDPSAAGQQ
ncbi:hypothetical protein APT56_25440 [Achromobacter denitrificans]|nr:hypothetical protein APT56_25440 [Achromobacter denitrificans]